MQFHYIASRDLILPSIEFSPGPGAINLDDLTFDRSLTFTLHVYSLQKSETYIKSEIVYVLWPLGQNYTRVYSYQINILEFLQYPLFCFD